MYAKIIPASKITKIIMIIVIKPRSLAFSLTILVVLYPDQHNNRTLLDKLLATNQRDPFCHLHLGKILIAHAVVCLV